jgi:hypothetical protein
MIGLVVDMADDIAIVGIDLDTSNWCLFPYWLNTKHVDIPAHEISAGWLIFGFTFFRYDFA